MTETIRVLLFKEEGFWVAQGLEHDICVQAETLEDLQINFEVAVRLESEEAGGLKRIAAAPPYFQERWSKRAGDYSPITSNDNGGNIEYGLVA
jgi:hypothetical protein